MIEYASLGYGSLCLVNLLITFIYLSPFVVHTYQ